MKPIHYSRQNFLLTLVSILLISLNFSQLYADDFYWVGGGGKWSEIQHWATSSGGTNVYGRVPGPSDNVYFDANSGFGTTTASRTIKVEESLIYCKDMNWEDAPNNPYFNADGKQIYIYGSLKLQPVMIFACNILNFLSNNSETIETADALGYTGYYSVCNFTFNGNGEWTLLDDVTTGRLTNTQIMHSYVYYYSGTLNLNGFTIKTGKFWSKGDLPRTLNMENSTFKLLLGGQSNGAMGYAWEVLGNNKTILTANSRIEYQEIINAYDFAAFNSDGDTYNDIIFTDPNGLFGILSGTASIHKLHLVGNATFNGDFSIDTLIIDSGRKALFTEGVTQTINDHLQLSSSCSPLLTLQAKSGFANIVLASTASYVANNVFFKGIHVSGQPFTATNSSDGGNNLGITFSPVFGTSSLYWIGGAGNWNDGNHWSTSSGGSPFGCVPRLHQNVIFDHNSGFATNDTIKLDGTNNVCKNITFNNAPNSPVLLGERQHYLVVYGSMYLQPDMVYAVHTTYFVSNSPGQEIDTKGVPFGIIGNTDYIGRMYFDGDGEWKFLNAVVTGGTGGEPTKKGSILFDKGTLNTNGQLVDICSFTTTITATPGNNNVRNLILGNSHINIHNNVHNDRGWYYYGSNRTLDAGTSTIEFVGTTTNTLHNTFTDNGVNHYHNLIFAAENSTATNLNGYGGVTANKIIFKGSANYYLKSVDSLIFAPAKVYYHRSGTITVNKYYSAETPPCQGLSDLSEVTSGQTVIAPGAEVHIEGAMIKNMTITGQTVTAYSSIDNGGNSGIIFAAPVSKTLYWVNGAGDWNDSYHWSATSGGVGGYCTPTSVDDVIFDNLSGFTGQDTVMLSQTLQMCRDMSWLNTTGTPFVLSVLGTNLRVYGSMLLQSNMIYKVNKTHFMSDDLSPKTITTNGVVIGWDADGHVSFNGNGIWDLQDDLSLAKNGIISFVKGSLRTNGVTVNAYSFDSDNSNFRNLELGNSTFNLRSTVYPWLYKKDNKTLDAGTSTINIVGTVNGSNVGNFRCDPTERYYHVTFTLPTANAGSIVGGINAQRVTFASNGYLYSDNTIDSLLLKEGKVYKLEGGKTQTIQKDLILSSTPCIFTTLTSLDNSQANLKVLGGNTHFNFAVVSKISAVNPLQFDYSDNQEGNSNISFVGSQTSLQSISAEVNVPMCVYPITLDVNDFLIGSATSFYWDNNITDQQLTITENGTHYLHMQYNAGCNLSEKIEVTCPLPVELIDFSLEEDDCRVLVKWTTASESNNAYFEIYRSDDGISWRSVGQVNGAGNSSQKINYSWVDDHAESNHVYYYYLQQVDMDGAIKSFSPKSIQLENCPTKLIVYPNPANEQINVISSSGFYSYWLIDELGRVISMKNFNSETQVYNMDVSSLPNGVYILQLFSEEGSISSAKFTILK